MALEVVDNDVTVELPGSLLVLLVARLEAIADELTRPLAVRLGEIVMLVAEVELLLENKLIPVRIELETDGVRLVVMLLYITEDVLVDGLEELNDVFEAMEGVETIEPDVVDEMDTEFDSDVRELVRLLVAVLVRFNESVDMSDVEEEPMGLLVIILEEFTESVDTSDDVDDMVDVDVLDD